MALDSQWDRQHYQPLHITGNGLIQRSYKNIGSLNGFKNFFNFTQRSVHRKAMKLLQRQQMQTFCANISRVIEHAFHFGNFGSKYVYPVVNVLSVYDVIVCC